jgi:hypothetical protein
MKRQLLGISIGILALIAGILIYAYGPLYLGQAEAHLDLTRGKYRLRVGAQSSAKFNEILSEEYGVGIVIIPLPDTGEEVMDARSCRPCQEADGYNAVMLDALNKRYGHYVLSRVWQLMEEDSAKERISNTQE